MIYRLEIDMERDEELLNMDWPEEKPVRPDLRFDDNYAKLEREWIQSNMHDRRNERATDANVG